MRAVRLKVLGAALALLSIAFAAGAHAQSPTVQIVAPYAAGGTADFLARIFSDKLQAQLGASVIVENRPGANGALGTTYVASAPPDGSRMLLPGPSVIVINPHIYDNLGYDPLKDLIPVARMTVAASALFVAASHPANNMTEFVAWAKSRDKPVSLGSAGVGGVTHIWIELLARATGIETLHVPYKGINPATVDVIGGQIDGQFSDIAPLMKLVEAGQLKMLGLVGPARNASVPQVPTIAEQGFPGIDGVSWYGLFAPAKTPPAAIDRVAEAIRKSLEDAAFVERLAQSGMAAAYMPPADFAKLVQDDTEWWGQVVRQNNISAE